MKKSLILLTAVLMAVGGSAAQTTSTDTITDPGTMPGDFTYIFDQLGDQAQIAVASAPVFGSQAEAAKAQARVAEERLAEANQLAEGNQSQRMNQVLSNYRNHIEKAQGLAAKSNSTEAMQKVQNMTEKHIDVLKRVKEKVPEQAQFGINTAIEASSDVMKKMQKGLETKKGMGKKPEDVGTPSSPF